MEYNKEQIPQLIQKYLEGRISAEEFDALWILIEMYPDEVSMIPELELFWKKSKSVPPLLSASDWENKMQLAKRKLDTTIEKEASGRTAEKLISRYRWVAAAAIFILFASGIYLLTTAGNEADIPQDQQTELKHDRLPGGDRALLKLSDGSLIVLDSAGNGVLAQQGGTAVIKQQDGQLVYNSMSQTDDPTAYNTLVTPRGGQYKITLPDGTKVWLNAASSLKYPVSFVGNERRVEITGEAYFEVAGDLSRPFRVVIDQMEVEVLGTHFNINGYSDESIIRTTLLEGKVKVASSGQYKFLKPGQQSHVSNAGNIKVLNDVNLEETIAWKEGNFQFENSDIKAVMRQLSRWYDVEVSYEGKIDRHFIGGISRNVKLSQVLNMLKQTGDIEFKVEGNKIMVIP